eukprot:10297081-Ditylum_brightwellii.AAC.1
MVTFSKPIAEDKPQDKYHMYKLHIVPYNASSSTYNLCGHQGIEHQQGTDILHNLKELPMR